MAYKLLTQDEQDEMLAQTLLSQERDHCAHTLNLARFADMLEVLPDGDYRKHIQDLHDQTEQRIEQVGAIMASLEKQIPPKARLDAARVRFEAKEAAARGKQ